MKKVMIIDDELDILDILERFLLRSGKLDVKVHSNPEAALTQAKNGGYDLILSDVMMPSINGLTILEEIKKTSPSTKVVLMTAYSTNAKKQKSEELFVDGYLEKPFVNMKAVEQQLFSILGI